MTAPNYAGRRPKLQRKWQLANVMHLQSSDRKCASIETGSPRDVGQPPKTLKLRPLFGCPEIVGKVAIASWQLRLGKCLDMALGCAAMAKLYFRYGTMDSAKSMNLLAVAHNYRKQGKQVLLLKPKIDDRFGSTKIASRSGLEAEADYMVDGDTPLPMELLDGVDCVLVDEAQFISPRIIEQFRRITFTPGIPVICYGLRTDFKTRLFPGAQRLMELSDRIEEVKVTCQHCQRKAIFNLRLVDGVAAVDGPQVQLGADESYIPVCWEHYDAAVRAASSTHTEATR